jgi:hypothetical protein
MATGFVDIKLSYKERKELIMPISGMVIKSGGTNSVAGGTDVTYVADGQDVPNGVHVVNASVSDFRVRGNATFKNRIPVYNQSSAKWTKDKKAVTLVLPKLLASGEVVFNLIRIEREVHPESTAAEALELNTQGAQMLFDTDFTNFWSVGSLA